MDKKFNKKNIEHQEYDEETMAKIRIYREIKSGLNRAKNEEIDTILGTTSNLDEIINLVSDSIDNYEQMRVLFKSWIFEGVIPDGYASETKNESSINDILNDYDFSNIPESAYDDPDVE